MELVTLDMIFGGVFAGLVIAAVGSTVTRRAVTKTVRRLMDRGAMSKADAMTADELELGWLGRRILRGQLYGKIICCANEYYVRTDKEGKQNPYKNPPLDMTQARFYIPEEKHFTADDRFPAAMPSYVTMAIGIVLMAVFFALGRMVAPMVIDMFVGFFM